MGKLMNDTDVTTAGKSENIIEQVKTKPRHSLGKTPLGEMDKSTRRSFQAEVMTSGLGSPYWMAPELLASIAEETASYTKQVDVFAYGMVLYEIMERAMPWDHEDFSFSHQMMDRVMAGKRPSITV